MAGKCIFSKRQLDVLHWLLRGKSNSEIADILNTSPSTIKNHIHDMLDVTGTSHRTGLVILVLQRGWVDLHTLEWRDAATRSRLPFVRPSSLT